MGKKMKGMKGKTGMTDERGFEPIYDRNGNFVNPKPFFLILL